MKLSDILNLLASILTLIFIIFLINRAYNTLCFSWIEYSTSFFMLFINMGINILASVGR